MKNLSIIKSIVLLSVASIIAILIVGRVSMSSLLFLKNNTFDISTLSIPAIKNSEMIRLNINKLRHYELGLLSTFNKVEKNSGYYGEISKTKAEIAQLVSDYKKTTDLGEDENLIDNLDELLSRYMIVNDSFLSLIKKGHYAEASSIYFGSSSLLFSEIEMLAIKLANYNYEWVSKDADSIYREVDVFFLRYRYLLPYYRLY